MSLEFTRFSLFKRRNGYYYILYYNHGHRRWKATNRRTKHEALAVLSDFQALLNTGSPSLSLHDFVARFLEYAETAYSPRTLDLYQRVLWRFCSLVGNPYLAELTTEHFDRYTTSRLKHKYRGRVSNGGGTEMQMKHVSPVSVNIELRALRAALNTARRWKLVRSNPFDEVQLASVPEKVPDFFTVEDFHRLLEHIRESWLKDIVVFAVLTGLRQGEILNLRWKDIDFARRVSGVRTMPG